MTEPMKISVGIDADMYPELYAKLSSLGKGARSEMLRKLASEALNNRAWAEVTARSTAQQASSDAQGAATPQGPRAAPVAPSGAAPAAPATLVRDVPGPSVAPMPTRSNEAVSSDKPDGHIDQPDTQTSAPTARFAAGRMSNALLRG